MSSTTVAPKIRKPNRRGARRVAEKPPVRRAPEVAPPLAVQARPCRCFPWPLAFEPESCAKCGREVRQ
jgi:hypothetical protein